MYELVLPGKRLLDGDAINALANLGGYATYYPITAKAGGGRTGATQVNYGLNVISTVISSSDSVLLPTAVQGQLIYLTNNGANTAQVFATGGNTIDGIAGNTGVSLPAGTSSWFVCSQTGKWFSVTSSGSTSPSAYGYSQPTTGSTVTAAARETRRVLDPAGTLATLTLVLPPSPRDGDIYEIMTSQEITTLTVNGAAAETVLGNSFTLNIASGASWLYRSANTKWYARY